MIYKNEFIVCKDHPNKEMAMLSQKDQCVRDLGKLIGETFDWKPSPASSDEEMDRYKLEIIVFTVDKWIEFKQKLFTLDQVRILELIKELESFGKPSGDAITNLADQMGYRGPSSHCKACEDEKSGVKHITAQKHTCRK